MAVIYVRTTGSDAGAGTFTDPYLTVAFAAGTAVAGDIIDIGPGTFPETLTIPWDDDYDFRGAGADQTIITSAVGAGVFSGFTASTEGYIYDLQVQALATAGSIFEIATILPGGSLVAMRCIFMPEDGEYVINDSTAADTVDYDIDLINCLLVGASQLGRGVFSLKKNRVTAVNTIFTDLEYAVDIGASSLGQRINSQSNVYFDNFRNIRPLPRDLDLTDIESDPLFIDAPNGDYRLTFSSSAKDTGRDILERGYGDDDRQPPSVVNFTSSAQGLDRGVFEFVGTGTLKTVNATNILAILSAFAEEFELLENDREQAREDRAIATAQPSALRDRFAALFGAYRINAWTLDFWREFLESLFVSFNDAPNQRAFNRTTSFIHAVEPCIFSYYKQERFPTITDLRLTVVRPPTPNLDVELSAGLFQVRRRWFRLAATETLTVTDDAVSVIYSDGESERDASVSDSDYDAVIKQSTDTSLRCGRVESTLTGSVTFRETETLVTGVGTAFTTEILEKTDRIKRDTESFFYQVLSVESDTSLTLRSEYEGADVFRKPATLARQIKVFGLVTAASGDVIEINQDGILGGTILDSGSDGEIDGTTFNFESASATFTSADLGRIIRILTATNSGNLGERTITSIVSPTEVTLADTTELVAETGTDWELVEHGFAFADSTEGRFHTFQVEIPLDKSSIVDINERQPLIEGLLANTKSVAKRMYFLYQDEVIAREL